MKITYRIVLTAFVASTLGLLLASYFSYLVTMNITRQQAERFLPLLAKNVSAHIVKRNELVARMAKVISYEIHSGDTHWQSDEEVFQLLERCLIDDSGIYGIMVAFNPELQKNQTPKALYVCRKKPEQGTDFLFTDFAKFPPPKVFGHHGWYQEREYYKVTKETHESHWTKPYFGYIEDGAPLVAYSVPLKDEKDRFLGVVVCMVGLGWLDEFISKMQFGNAKNDEMKIDEIILIAENGFVLADKSWGFAQHNIMEVAEKQNNSALTKLAGEILKHVKTDTETHLIPYRSEDCTQDGVFLTLNIDNADGDDETGWVLGIFLPHSIFRKVAMSIGLRQATVASVGILVTLLLLIFVARKITKPLRQLHLASQVIGHGHFDAEIPALRGSDEIATLSQSFRKMQSELKEYMTNLAETTRAKERIDADLKAAHQIQMSLLPNLLPETPYRDRFDLASSIEPAKDVGGDFYDYFMIDEETLCLIIADVSGKGVTAALLAATCSAFLRSSIRTAIRHDETLVNAVKETNREICHNNEQCMFVTLFVMMFSLKTGLCRYVNAGHNPPFWLRADHTLELLNRRVGPPIGVTKNAGYFVETIELQPKEAIFLYTDGVTEALNTELEVFGETRVKRCLAAIEESDVTVTSEQMIEVVRSEIRAFTNDAGQSDDITMLALRRLAPDYSSR